MVIILKSLCFAIWLVMMLYLIKGSRIKSVPQVNEVRLQLDDDEDAEKCIRQALNKLEPQDRLIIENLTCNEINARIIARIMAANPSILCTTPLCL
jgi:hypothetical protein